MSLKECNTFVPNIKSFKIQLQKKTIFTECYWLVKYHVCCFCATVWKEDTLSGQHGGGLNTLGKKKIKNFVLASVSS